MVKKSRRLWIGIYSLLMILLGIMITVSVTGPQHNLFVWQMILGTVLGTAGLISAFFVWKQYVPQKVACNGLIYYTLLVLFGISLYFVSCIGRNLPESFTDYKRIWQAASELSQGMSLSEEWYFKIYANNIKPMLFLSVIFKASSHLNIQDPFYFVLLISVLNVVSAVWCAGILVGNSTVEYKRYRIPVLLMFVFLLPVWANTQAFYTDSMSFCTGVVALAGIKLSYEVNKKGKGLFLVGSGVVAAVGIAAKATAAIPLIAGLLTLLFCGRIKRLLSRNMLFFILTLVLAYIIIGQWANTYEISQLARETHEPAIDWIALGMKGDGSWSDNSDYILHINELSTTADKIEYSKEYIWENRSNFYDANHLIQKIRCNFASGNLGAKDYAYCALQPNNIIWELFSPWGSYYWRASQFCFCYAFSLYVVILGGIILTIILLFQKKEIPLIKVIADMTLLGIMVFLMIWEANNRQMYNQMPVIIIGSVMNIRQIISWASYVALPTVRK